MAQNWLSVLGRKAQAWGIDSDVEVKLEALIEGAQDALHDARQSERNAAINQQVRTAFGTLTDFMRDVKRRNFFMPP
jgi:hypothetical protein